MAKHPKVLLPCNMGYHDISHFHIHGFEFLSVSSSSIPGRYNNPIVYDFISPIISMLGKYISFYYRSGKMPTALHHVQELGYDCIDQLLQNTSRKQTYKCV